MKHEVQKAKEAPLYFKDVAYVKSDTTGISRLESVQLDTKDQSETPVVIDGYTLLQKVLELFPEAEVRFLGPVSTLIKEDQQKRKRSIFLLFSVWILLFIGSGMAIMNFHYDVSMSEVHQRIHFLFTGEEVERPWLIQIPYSIGLGLGMLLFFNRWPARTVKKEPSPLDVEVFKYQEDLDQYVTLYHNSLEKKNDS
ncbi:stage V sporulation protein AA [Salimicrobium halophilum]|nr:stage V sporulation protein AA [Salimicrobium halophilum]